MHAENKKHQIYLNGELIPVTEEVYKAWYRPIWRTHDFARRHGQCACADWRLCEGDCGLCEHKRAGDQVSIEQSQECGLQMAAYRADPSEIVESRAAYDALLLALDAIDSNGRKIAQMLLEGVDDRTAAEMLGLPRSTYSDKKLRIRRELEKQKKLKNF